MNIWAWIVAPAMAATLSTGSAAADRLVDVSSVQKVAALMREAGYDAQVKKAPTGQTFIQSKANGREFHVVLHGCKNDEACEGVQLYSVEDEIDIFTPALAEEWNSQYGFLKVTIDGQGRMVKSIDISAFGKLTFENFKSYFDIYEVLDQDVTKFVAEKYLDQAAAATRKGAVQRR